MKAAGWIAILFAALLLGNAAWGAFNNVGHLQSAQNALDGTPCRGEEIACGIAPDASPASREIAQTAIGLLFLIPGLAMLLHGRAPKSPEAAEGSLTLFPADRK